LKKKLPDNGFTLLELVISLALLSIILVALYNTFFLSQKALDGVDESLLKLHECRVAMDTMSREAESVQYGQSNKNTLFTVKDRDIDGKPSSMFVFTSFSPLRPGLSLVSYYVEEKDNKLTLYKKIDDPYAPPNAAVEKQGADIIEDIKAFSVEASDGKSWVKTWDASNNGKIPVELRITLTILVKDRPITMYETIEPKIGTAL
jgi:prepilin-type N-terminal cleavage/methylation domain-containing protein